MALIGAHVSTAGGTHKAFERGEKIGCTTVQIFVKSPNQWRAKPLDPADVEKFHEAHSEHDWPVVAHAAYLINLASPDPETAEKSRNGLIDELGRCDLLGVLGLVFHPGAHVGAGVDAGIEQIARNVDQLLAAVPDVNTKLLLENTAGQGTTLGARFEELKRIIDLLDQPGRVGVCLDTCHAFAAGYDVSMEDGYEATIAELDRLVGLDRLACLHLNDSKHPLGSRKDRHENLGEGQIGSWCFERLVNDPRLANVPKVLETPLGDDEQGHARDMEKLRSYL
ncbi:MAG: deoxyribonuclease IV [Truepera sp.]|jgi:deoxyribonuclease-4|nr:deoxyribonuclease IV [Truepera sp.]